MTTIRLSQPTFTKIKPIQDRTEITYLLNEIPNYQIGSKKMFWGTLIIFTLKLAETVFYIPPASISFSKIIQTSSKFCIRTSKNFILL